MIPCIQKELYSESCKYYNIKSVIPVEVREKCNEEVQVSEVSVADKKLNTDIPKTQPLGEWTPEVDLSGLIAEQMKLIAQQMIRKEFDCFSRYDKDIGCSEKFKMNINLTDDIQV